MKRKSLRKKSLRKKSLKKKSLKTSLRKRKLSRNKKIRSKKNSLKRKSRRKIYDGVLSDDDKKFIEWCKKITNDYNLIFINKYNEVSKDKKLSTLDLFPSFEDEDGKNIDIIRANCDLIKKYIDIILLLNKSNISFGPEEDDYAKQFNSILTDFNFNFIKTLDTICKPSSNLIENHFNYVI
jgi:hypothetical protein